MAPSVPAAGLPRPRKMLSATFAEAPAIGKKLSDDEIARQYGRGFARALEISGITQQELAGESGYANQSPISKLLNPRRSRPRRARWPSSGSRSPTSWRSPRTATS
jgi:hypothetical protein